VSDTRSPHDIEAERSVLGAALVQNDTIPAIAEVLGPDAFFRQAHQAIFAAVLDLHQRGAAVDLITLRDALGRAGHLDGVGGPAYIAALVDGVPRSINAAHYAQVVRRHADARAFIEAATQAARDVSADPEALAGGAVRVLDRLSTLAATGGDIDRGHERRVNEALDRERATREARKRLEAEERGPADIPPFETLAERLRRPIPITRFRIDGWLPMGGRALLAAQFKAGKTSLIANLVRSLTDGDPFLGRDRVVPIPGTVCVVDFEMSEGQLTAWYRDQRLRHPDRAILVPMRGRAGAFNIIDPAVRAAWAAHLRAHQVGVLVLDCVRPMMDALGLDEHKDGGRFLVAVDGLLAEAGIGEAVVVHHMGHTGERARGDSRFRDWPDVEWRLVRQDGNPSSPRFLTAFGRDVDIPEQQLTFDPVTRRITIGGGSRADAKAGEALGDVVSVLKAGPLSGRAVLRALADSDHSDVAIRAALRRGTQIGALVPTTGNRRAILYSVPASDSVIRSDSPVIQSSSGSVRQCVYTHDAQTTHTEPATREGFEL